MSDTRDEIARILEQISSEGSQAFTHPRALDAALDAIFCTITEPYKEVLKYVAKPPLPITPAVISEMMIKAQNLLEED